MGRDMQKAYGRWQSRCDGCLSASQMYVPVQTLQRVQKLQEQIERTVKAIKNSHVSFRFVSFRLSNGYVYFVSRSWTELQCSWSWPHSRHFRFPRISFYLIRWQLLGPYFWNCRVNWHSHKYTRGWLTGWLADWLKNWSRIFLKDLVNSQPAFYEREHKIHQWILSWASLISFIISQPKHLSFTLTLYYRSTASRPGTQSPIQWTPVTFPWGKAAAA